MAKALLFRTHALERMFERRVVVEEVKLVLDSGKTIEDYPNDRPYPSRLMLGWVDARPPHVVAAESEDTIVVVTVYEPDPLLWEADFEKRRVP